MNKPVIILSHAQLGENIGAAARAMLNFGLTELRLVKPRDGWPNRKADAMAAGADAVMSGVQVFPRTEDALADLNLVFATTGRDRLMSKRAAAPNEAVREIVAAQKKGIKCGIIFGAERTGLTNEEIVLCDALLCIPTNPDFSSLNLAQAVAVISYQWWQITEGTPVQTVKTKLARSRPAAKEDLIGFFEHIEGELDKAEFLFPPDKRAVMVRNLRNLWQRAELTYQEVQTLRGIVRALTGGSKRRNRKDDK